MNIKTIPGDAQISISVPGTFYQRLQYVLMLKFKDKTPEQQIKMIEEISKEDVVDDDMFELQTLSALVKVIEIEAEKQGKTVEETIPDEELN